VYPRAWRQADRSVGSIDLIIFSGLVLGVARAAGDGEDFCRFEQQLASRSIAAGGFDEKQWFADFAATPERRERRGDEFGLSGFRVGRALRLVAPDACSVGS